MSAAIVAACMAAAALAAPVADYVYLPPQTPPKAALPMPAAWYLEAGYPTAAIALPARGKEAAPAPGTPQIAGRGEPLALDAASLLGAGRDDGTAMAYAGALHSPGAAGLRIEVQLGALDPGAELWVMAPGSAEPLGPFARRGGTRWLPTVFGDTAAIVVRAPRGALPAFRVTAALAWWEDPRKAAGEDPDACQTPIACTEDAALHEVAAGIGLMTLAGRDRIGRPTLYLCTGALVNNPLTPELEPLLLTANHCFENGVDAADVEVFWDMRWLRCDVLDAGTSPPLRSRGLRILAASPRFDAQLIALDEAPAGPYGRAWLGWDANPPTAGSAAVALHHPLGAPMVVAYGRASEVGVRTPFGIEQVEVRWRLGHTEGGSSGSPGLLADAGLRIFGMLSNGLRNPRCENQSNILDNYAGFAAFFPVIAPYLYQAPPETEPAPPEPRPCMIGALLGRTGPAADLLRRVRDGASALWPEASALVRAYYVWGAALE